MRYNDYKARLNQLNEQISRAKKLLNVLEGELLTLVSENDWQIIKWKELKVWTFIYTPLTMVD